MELLPVVQELTQEPDGVSLIVLVTSPGHGGVNRTIPETS